MGLELARAYPEAGEVFRTADRVLGYRLSALVASGDERLLAWTDVTQPALLAASLAAWRALQTELPGLPVGYAAGLSLGEYSALTATEALDLESALRLVGWRGRFMEDAARRSDGGMLAVLGLDRATVADVVREAGGGEAWVANFNAPGQTVVAGRTATLEPVAREVAARGGRAVPLRVGGAFHCPLMTGAASRLGPLLRATRWRLPALPVYANATGRPYRTVGELPARLEAQVAAPVLWEDIVLDLSSRGVRLFVEVGPGRTLAGLIARTVPDAVTVGVSDLASLGKAVELLRPYALEVVS